MLSQPIGSLLSAALELRRQEAAEFKNIKLQRDSAFDTPFNHFGLTASTHASEWALLHDEAAWVLHLRQSQFHCNLLSLVHNGSCRCQVAHSSEALLWRVCTLAAEMVSQRPRGPILPCPNKPNVGPCVVRYLSAHFGCMGFMLSYTHTRANKARPRRLNHRIVLATKHPCANSSSALHVCGVRPRMQSAG